MPRERTSLSEPSLSDQNAPEAAVKVDRVKAIARVVSRNTVVVEKARAAKVKAQRNYSEMTPSA